MGWAEDSALEEYPMRVLRGASGVIFHQTREFLFAAFFDDEKGKESFAAFQYSDFEGDKPGGWVA